MTQGIPWSSVRGAIRSWIVGGAAPDIAADHVIWFGQQKGVPGGMYVTIGVDEEQDYGCDVNTYVDNLDGTFTEHATGPRTATLTITVYGGVQQVDATVPYQVASRIRSRVGLSGVQDALAAASVGVMKWSTITTPGRGLNSTVFEPRAMFSVIVSLTSDVSDLIDVFDHNGPIASTIT